MLTATRIRQFFSPPAPPSEPSAPWHGFTSHKAAADAIRAAESAKQARIDAVAERDAYAEESKSRLAELNAQVEEAQRRERNSKAVEARSFLLSGSKPSEEEERRNREGLALMHKRISFRNQHGVTETKLSDPSESDDAHRLADLLEERRERQARESKSKAATGTTADFFRLRQIYPEIEQLELSVGKARSRYEAFLQAEEMQRRVNELFAERDRLREERETAVIAEALKAK